MIIGGFQKFSLLDYPGRISSIIFTQGCNFNCVYCHNRELINRGGKTLSPDEILKFLKGRRKMLDAVVITGGEPTLQPDLTDFMKRVKKLGFLVKLDTNGSRPDVIRKILDAKVVDYIAMDIKAPLEKYSVVTNIRIAPKTIEDSILLVKNSGIRREFRTTVIKSLLTERDLQEIRNLTGDAPLFFQQCNLSEKHISYTSQELINFSETCKCGVRC